MTYATTLKRAARHNPAWETTRIYSMATDGTGAAITDASGTFQYDLAEETFALRDYTREDSFTIVQPYDGNATLIVISEEGPDPDAVILWGGVFYSISEVIGGDSLRGTVRYQVKALPEDHVIPIRNNSL